MRFRFLKWWRQRREPQGVDLLTKSTGIAPYFSRFLNIPFDRTGFNARGKQAALLDRADNSARNFGVFQEEIHHDFDLRAQNIHNPAQHRYREGAALRDKYRAHLAVYEKEAEYLKDGTATPSALLQVRDQVGQLVDRRRATAKSYCVEQDEATADYSDFMRAHPVGASANFAKNRVIPVALIIATVLVETIVNAFFFINSTPYGIVGSLFEVVFFAPINVAAAVVLALFSLRYIRHSKVMWRVAAAVSGIALVIFILGFNVYLAGVRIYLDGKTSADLMQILNMILSSRVLEVMDYKAIGVLTLGLSMAVIAAYEAYQLFDPYPGYSQVCQRREFARDALEGFEMDYMDELNALGREAVGKLEGDYEECVDFAARHRKLLEISRDDRNRELQQHAQLNGMYEAAVKSFQASYAANLPVNDVKLPMVSTLTPVTEGVETTVAEEDALDLQLQEKLSLIEVHMQNLKEQILDLVAEKRAAVGKIIKSVQFELHNSVIMHPTFQAAESEGLAPGDASAARPAG